MITKAKIILITIVICFSCKNDELDKKNSNSDTNNSYEKAEAKKNRREEIYQKALLVEKDSIRQQLFLGFWKNMSKQEFDLLEEIYRDKGIYENSLSNNIDLSNLSNNSDLSKEKKNIIFGQYGDYVIKLKNSNIEIHFSIHGEFRSNKLKEVTLLSFRDINNKYKNEIIREFVETLNSKYGKHYYKSKSEKVEVIDISTCDNSIGPDEVWKYVDLYEWNNSNKVVTLEYEIEKAKIPQNGYSKGTIYCSDYYSGWNEGTPQPISLNKNSVIKKIAPVEHVSLTVTYSDPIFLIEKEKRKQKIGNAELEERKKKDDKFEKNLNNL